MAGDITRRDWGFTFSSAIPTPSAIVPYDDRPISDGQMIAIHIYVFGGLAFFVGTVVSALVWYGYMICYRRKLRDLPEELDFDASRLLLLPLTMLTVYSRKILFLLPRTSLDVLGSG